MKVAAAAVVASGLDAQFGDQLVLKALEGLTDAGSYDTTGNYNQFWMVDRDFTHQTSLVVAPADGQIPDVTEAATRRSEERRAYLRAHPADGPEDRPLGERCANFGVPRLGAGYNSYLQIFQTPSHAAILKEMAHDVNLVSLDGTAHAPDGVRFWNGDSRGRWEGDTLVVETTNLPESNRVVEERFTRVNADTIDYRITVTDPAEWTAPWTAAIAMNPSGGPLFEYACHEGNHSVPNMLTGSRAEDAP